MPRPPFSNLQQPCVSPRSPRLRRSPALAAALVAALPPARDTRDRDARDARDDPQLLPQLEAMLQLLPTFAERAMQRIIPGVADGNGGGGSNGTGRGNGRLRQTNSTAGPRALPELVDGLPDIEGLLEAAGRVGLFAVDALTPWDYDRHDFGVTFAHTWEESELLPRVWRAAGGGGGGGGAGAPASGGSNSNSGAQQRGRRGDAIGGGTTGSSSAGDAVRADRFANLVPTQVKVTSTVKPVEGEWKVTARSKLWQSRDGDGVLFGKAGMFLAGKRVPYIGVEADRVWALPVPQRAGGASGRTKVFANVNYRSSRAPRKGPVRWSFGLQHGFAMGRGLEITLRVGLHPFEKRKVFATPVPNGRYY